MYAQVLIAPVRDVDGFHQALDRWKAELAPDGYLGGVCGVSSSGTGVVISYYETADAAHAQGEDEREQQWLSDLAQHLDGDLTSRQAEEVVDSPLGDLTRAGFVQIIEGTVSDPDALRRNASTDNEAWADFRPEIIGSRTLLHNAGKYTMVVYFDDEASAREGEKKEPPAELAEEMKEMEGLDTEEPVFHDLTDPWVYTAD